VLSTSDQTVTSNGLAAAGAARPPQVGDVAPTFSLDSVQGGTVSLTSYQSKQNVLVWFSRGFTCPFCRRYMAQLALAIPSFRKLHCEIIQISPDLASQARLFFRNYTLSFPFACDTDKQVFRAYGLRDLGALQSAADTVVSFSTALARGEFARTFYASWLDTFATGRQAPRRLAEHGLHEMEQGMFLVDRAGLIRSRRVFGPLENIAGSDELLASLAGL
jgi:putative peptide zinc metalloprotease protein